VRVALQRKRGDSFDLWRSDRVLAQLNGESMALIEAVGLSDFAGRFAAELPYGRKRALEIATTLALDPEMMLLDEPTAGMTAEEIGKYVRNPKGVDPNSKMPSQKDNLSERELDEVASFLATLK